MSAAWCSALSVKPNHAVWVGPRLNCAIIAAAAGHALARWMHATAMANVATKQRALGVVMGVATSRDSYEQKYVAEHVCPELSQKDTVWSVSVASSTHSRTTVTGTCTTTAHRAATSSASITHTRSSGILQPNFRTHYITLHWYAT